MPVVVKVAVTVRFTLIVIVVGLADPLRSPLQPEKTKPAAGVAVRVTTVPAVVAGALGCVSRSRPLMLVVSVKVVDVAPTERMMPASARDGWRRCAPSRGSWRQSRSGLGAHGPVMPLAAMSTRSV